MGVEIPVRAIDRCRGRGLALGQAAKDVTFPGKEDQVAAVGMIEVYPCGLFPVENVSIGASPSIRQSA